MTVPRTTLAALLGLLLTAGSAHAATPWSAPLTIGPPSNGSEVRGLAFGPSGTGLVSWRLGSTQFIAPIAGSGALGTPRMVPDDLGAGPALAPTRPLDKPPTLAGPPAVVFLRRILAPGPPRPGNTYPRDRSRISWAQVAADGTLGRVRALRTANCLTCVIKLAVNASGDAIAAWAEDDRIVATWRPSGGTFERPVTLWKASTGQYPALEVAIGADGRAIVVDAGAVVRARMRTRRTGFGATMTVGRGDQSVRATAAISNGGQTIVAWGSQDGGEQADKPWIVRAARLTRGSRRFSATQTLDAGSSVDRPEGRISLAFTPGGKATVAWSAVAARNTFPVMAAAAPRGGRFGPAQLLAPSGAVGAIAVRADGAAVVAWSRLVGSQQPVQVFGSVRAPGAPAFGAPEEIGGLESGFFPPIVAFDPVSGRPTVAWGSRAAVSAPGISDDATVHFATRVAP
jgi:hypothetical protein